MKCKTNNSSILIEKIKTFVTSINENKNIPIICKYLVYFSVFDILTSCAFLYKNGMNNKLTQCGKYKIFINHYSNWKYKSYISYLQLECILKDIKNKDLKNQIKEKIEISRVKTDEFFYHNPTEPIFADKVDFTEQELKKGLNSSQLEISVKDMNKIHQARYDNLLYKLRCFVVHELRFPDPPNGSDTYINIEKPLYFKYTEILNEEKEPKEMKLESGCRLYLSPKLILLILEECIEKSKREINYDDNYYKIFEATPKCWVGEKI